MCDARTRREEKLLRAKEICNFFFFLFEDKEEEEYMMTMVQSCRKIRN